MVKIGTKKSNENQINKIKDKPLDFRLQGNYMISCSENCQQLSVSKNANPCKCIFGIIGGSGLEKLDIFENAKEIIMETKFGRPSSPIISGKLNGIEIFILSRHGRNHEIMPSNVNNRANISALKKLGCTHILATTACGSLKEQIKPGDFVILNQFIDRTTKRASTFFESGKVCHISMAEPFCEKLRQILIKECRNLKLKCHPMGTVVTIEGPRFSTKAESNLFRQWNADVINMSTVPECVLAREAGICYAAIAMSTDYDCWKEHEKSVTMEMILNVMKKNAENVTKLLLAAVQKINHQECSCREAIKSALI
jgi:5'-methylthioadenosine phosphorylase